MGTNIPKPSMYVPQKVNIKGGLGGLAGRPGRTTKEFPLEIDVRLCTPLGIYQE